MQIGLKVGFRAQKRRMRKIVGHLGGFREFHVQELGLEPFRFLIITTLWSSFRVQHGFIPQHSLSTKSISYVSQTSPFPLPFI